MDVEKKIIDYYGSLLVTFDPVHLKTPDVEATTAIFLENVGLPKMITDGTELEITTTGSLSKINFSKRIGKELYVFGSSDLNMFSIASKTGWVYLLDEEKAYFVNSHIKYLLLFCILFNEIHAQRPYDVESDATYRKRTKEIREEFSKYDKKAIGRSFIWTFKLEEVRNGII